MFRSLSRRWTIGREEQEQKNICFGAFFLSEGIWCDWLEKYCYMFITCDSGILQFFLTYFTPPPSTAAAGAAASAITTTATTTYTGNCGSGGRAYYPMTDWLTVQIPFHFTLLYGNKSAARCGRC